LECKIIQQNYVKIFVIKRTTNPYVKNPIIMAFCRRCRFEFGSDILLTCHDCEFYRTYPAFKIKHNRPDWDYGLLSAETRKQIQDKERKEKEDQERKSK
jgi:RNase P subunit RPR2